MCNFNQTDEKRSSEIKMSKNIAICTVGEKTYKTVRSTFVINGEGKIVFAGYDMNVNGQINELLKQIEKTK